VNRLFIATVFLLDFLGEEHLMPESMMALGFTIIAAYLVGKLFTRFRLPKITGYILAGIVTGPYLINLLSVPVVENLQLIDNIALSLIALTAGGEFRYREIRPQMKSIVSAIAWKIVFVLTGFILLFVLFGNYISFLENVSIEILIAVGLLMGSIAVATSPATVIAIITEMKAHGRFTDFVLVVTVFKDIIVVLLFSFALSISQPLIQGHTGLHLGYVLSIVLELSISLIIGIAAGALIVLYLKFVDIERPFFLLGFILLGIELSLLLHIKIILVFMIAGFFVQNFSDSGNKLIEGIEKSSLPIYVIFFSIAGATLNLPIFYNNWFFALVLVGVRILTTYQGTFLGTKLSRAPVDIQNYSWMGFIGQAGLSLGLAALVSQYIPGQIGMSIKTLIISAIAINQILGPILFRFVLLKVGEAHQSSYSKVKA
jgi:Kef-type K+ transport system membrane component KefB